VVRKWFPNQLVKLDNLTTKGIRTALAYRNNSTDVINGVIAQGLKPEVGKRTEISVPWDAQPIVVYKWNKTWDGSKLVCILPAQDNAGTPMRRRFEYQIVDINKTAKTLTLVDELAEEKFAAGHVPPKKVYQAPFKQQYVVSMDTIKSCFRLAHCKTVHSSQGSTINAKYAIADWMDDLATKKWFISAITRCTKLSDLHFIDEHIKTPDKQDELKTFIKGMLQGYRRQDKNKFGELPPEDVANYLRVEDVERMMHECLSDGVPICYKCGTEMLCGKAKLGKAAEGSVMTVNRTNNSRPHLRTENCELMCRKCNCGTGHD
jgi:hypothetical protein